VDIEVEITVPKSVILVKVAPVSPSTDLLTVENPPAIEASLLEVSRPSKKSCFSMGFLELMSSDKVIKLPALVSKILLPSATAVKASEVISTTSSQISPDSI
jgi:hypothetical protein